MNKHTEASTPFSNNPTLHDNIGNIKADLDALADSSYEQGVEYMESACLVLKHKPEYGSVIGANLAFSCELFLKSMLYTEKRDNERKHNLLSLYKMLSDEKQNRIKASFKEVYNNDLSRSNVDFEVLMDEIGGAFVFQRYAHERNRLVMDGGTLLGLAWVLRTIIQRTRAEELE